jgi:hypothetical protein
MKATKLKQLSLRINWLRGAMTMVAVACLAMLSTACSKSDGGGAPVPPVLLPTGSYGGVPNCQGCPGSPKFLTSVLSRGISSFGMPVEMALDIYGDYNSAMQSTYAIGSYFGPFAATGYIFIQGGMQECGVPPGQLMVQTQSPGVWGNDGAGRSGENILLVGVGGPIQINVYLSGYTMPATPAIQGSDGRTYPYSFQTTTMQIKRMDTSATCTLILQ